MRARVRLLSALPGPRPTRERPFRSVNGAARRFPTRRRRRRRRPPAAGCNADDGQGARRRAPEWCAMQGAERMCSKQRWNRWGITSLHVPSLERPRGIRRSATTKKAVDSAPSLCPEEPVSKEIPGSCTQISNARKGQQCTARALCHTHTHKQTESRPSYAHALPVSYMYGGRHRCAPPSVRMAAAGAEWCILPVLHEQASTSDHLALAALSVLPGGLVLVRACGWPHVLALRAILIWGAHVEGAFHHACVSQKGCGTIASIRP